MVEIQLICPQSSALTTFTIHSVCLARSPLSHLVFFRLRLARRRFVSPSPRARLASSDWTRTKRRTSAAQRAVRPISVVVLEIVTDKKYIKISSFLQRICRQCSLFLVVGFGWFARNTHNSCCPSLTNINPTHTHLTAPRVKWTPLSALSKWWPATSESSSTPLSLFLSLPATSFLRRKTPRGLLSRVSAPPPPAIGSSN